MPDRRILFALLCCLTIEGCHSAARPPSPADAIAKPDCPAAGTTQPVSIAPHVEAVVYLPPCYDSATRHPYPVLYLLPGFGGGDRDWFNSGAEKVADESILNGDIPPFLIVGTPDTFDDLDSHVVSETILPYIEARYPVARERRFRAVAGGSYGGAAAYHLAFRHPELFSSAGIFGNGAARGEEDSIRAWLDAIPKAIRPRVFLNVGESDVSMLERVQALVPILDAAGISHFDVFSPGTHSYNYWLTNFPAYFNWLAQGWRSQ